MKVHLATAYPTPWSYLPLFRELAAASASSRHELTDDPTAADIILFVDARHEHGDWTLKRTRNHPLARGFPEKAFIYNEMDQPWCAMPGVYVSMPAGAFNPRRQRACGYAITMNQYVSVSAPSDAEPDLLLSFMGRHCHRTRDQILALRHPRAFLRDTSAITFFGTTGPDAEVARREYADVLRRSRFVLCPRGAGPSSFRLFETMAAGRAPVIISDEWVPPAGPCWNEFSLRVPESDIPNLIPLLEERESEHVALGTAARKAWEQWFAPSVIFGRMVDACVEIARARRLPERLLRCLPDSRKLRLHAREAKARVRTLSRAWPSRRSAQTAVSG
jgi:hypothetical protein